LAFYAALFAKKHFLQVDTLEIPFANLLHHYSKDENKPQSYHT
jgi:hypothetical protein